VELHHHQAVTVTILNREPIEWLGLTVDAFLAHTGPERQNASPYTPGDHAEGCPVALERRLSAFTKVSRLSVST
jgi:hypothetical protein